MKKPSEHPGTAAAGPGRLALPAVLAAWNRDDFLAVLKAELRALAAGTLPLEAGTVQGGMVDDSDIAVTLLGAREEGAWLSLEIGVFFTEVVGGCSCGDEPAAEHAYCELQVRIDRRSAEARIRALGP